MTVPPTPPDAPEPAKIGRVAAPEVTAMRGTEMTAAAATAESTNGILRAVGATTKSGMATSKVNCWVRMATAMRMPAPIQ